MSAKKEYGILGEEKTTALLKSALEAANDQGVELRDEDGLALLRWAEKVVIENAMIELMLEGQSVIGWINNEPMFWRR